MSLVKSSSPNSTSVVYPNQMCSSPSAATQKVFTKRIRKCHSAKKTSEQSIAPLLETISALAVNSDPSDDEEEYQEYQGIHEEDEDGVEDYDFEQNLNEEQKLCSEATNKSFVTDQGDNVQSCSEDLQYLGQNQTSSTLPQLLQNSDLKPVNAFIVSEPFCSPISRVSSSAVNRPRFELSGIENNTNKWSPQSKVTNAQHCSVISSNNTPGKCVRFNADVQVSSVSPRLTHKTASANGGNSMSQHSHYNFHRHHCTEYNRPIEMPASDVSFNDQNCHLSDIGSNTYDEVASTTGSQTLHNANNANEHQPVNNLQGNRGVVRDLSAAELQCKFKKIHLHDERELSLQPLYSNIDQVLSENKVDNKTTNPSISIISQQKSILKDPLCAKLRSAIRKGQFATNDLTQLENEIDSLFYGNDSAKTDLNTAKATSRVNVMDNEEKSTCDMLAPDLLAGLDSKEELKNGKPFKNQSPSNAFKTFSINNSVSENHNDVNSAPCNSYIKMIEEKYRNKEAYNLANHNKQKYGKNVNQVKNTCKRDDADPKTKLKLAKANNHFKLNNLIIEKNYSSKFPTTFQPSHQLQQPNSNMPMFNATMDQLMVNIIHETSKSADKTESSDKVKQPENHCKQTVSPNKTISQIPKRNVPIPLSKNTTRRNNLYSFFADPVKGPSINNLMDELSRNCNSFSDNESVKSGTSTLSKSLVENHIYEEILYECFDEQDQLDSMITEPKYQLNSMNFSSESETVSNKQMLRH